MSCYNIGNKSFRTKRESLDYTRSLISNLGCCVIDAKHPNFEFFISLLNHHPEKDEKIGIGVKTFTIMRNVLKPSVFHMMVNRHDGSSIDFSWRFCCEFKKPNKHDDLNKALRHAISKDTIEYKNNMEKMICNLCGLEDLPYSDFHVDHIKPFREIKSEFLKTEPEIPYEFGSDRETFSTCFKDEDFEFKERWYQFHRNQCQFQILCAKCNSDKR